VLALVVGGDGDVDVAEGRVGVAESNNGDVDVRSLTDRLVVGARVGDNQQARLEETLLDLVSEGTGGVAARHGGGTSVRRVLEHGTLSVGAGRDDAHVGGVLDGDDGAGSEGQLLPGLADVQDVHTVRAALPDVAGHLEVQVLGTKVALASQQLLDIFFSGGEYRHCKFKDGSRLS